MTPTDPRPATRGPGAPRARGRGSSGVPDAGGDGADHGPDDRLGLERDALLEAALAAAREGDEPGFVLLWRTLHPPLLRYLRVRGDDHAEDVAAETWLHVARGLARFEGDVAAFRAWLFTIARNRAADEGRARSRRPAQVLMADPHLGVRTPAAPSAEHDADEQAATQRALELVRTLPPLQAEVVLLRVVAGLDVADVAALVGRPPGTVRVMVHRALRSLADRVPAPREAALP